MNADGLKRKREDFRREIEQEKERIRFAEKTLQEMERTEQLIRSTDETIRELARMPKLSLSCQMNDIPDLRLPPAIVNVPSAKAAYENKMFVIKMTDTAKLPIRSSDSAVGYDLFADTGAEIKIFPQRMYRIPTNIKVCLPMGTCGRITPKAEFGFEEGIDVLSYIIDADCCIDVIMIRHDASPPFYLKTGRCIAQLIIERISLPQVEEITESKSKSSEIERSLKNPFQSKSSEIEGSLKNPFQSNQ